MTIPELDWECFVRDAQEVSHPEGPKKLLAVLNDRNIPFGRDGDLSEQLWDAHQSDLGAVTKYRHFGQPLAEDDRAVWLDRLAWLLKELETCEKTRLSLGQLEAVLAVSRAFSSDKSIWERLPSTYLSDNLFGCMAGLVGAIHCEFSSSGQREPVWEREAVDDFIQADNDGNWPKIEARWRTIASAFRPSQNLAEATACLCSADTGMQALASAIDQFDSILPIMNVANAMSPRQIGKVAPLLKSGRGRFGFIQNLAFNHPRNDGLSQETLESLATLFRDVQQDIAEWRKWMMALNRFPVRSKALQPAFGLSLANSTTDAKSAYIEAISLSTSRGESREAVSECLAAFARCANLEERRQLWKLAQQRWARWNYGERDPECHLTWMATSELDYGVIGYTMENLPAPEQEKALICAYNEMNKVAGIWHRDATEHHSAWYRALSKWQIYKYVQQIVEGNVNWELPRRAYLPFDPKQDRYFAMTYPTNTPYR